MTENLDWMKRKENFIPQNELKKVYCPCAVGINVRPMAQCFGESVDVATCAGCGKMIV